MSDEALLAMLLKAQPKPKPATKPKPRPRPIHHPTRPPKPLPPANCQFAFYPDGTDAIRHTPADWGPAHIVAAFAAGQEAGEGDLRFQWTHVLIVRKDKKIQDPWPDPNAGARPGDTPGPGDGTAGDASNHKVFFYPLRVNLFGRVPPKNLDFNFNHPLGNIAYYVIFAERVNRNRPQEHIRVYLRRAAGREA